MRKSKMHRMAFLIKFRSFHLFNVQCAMCIHNWITTKIFFNEKCKDFLLLEGAHHTFWHCPQSRRLPPPSQTLRFLSEKPISQTSFEIVNLQEFFSGTPQNFSLEPPFDFRHYLPPKNFYCRNVWYISSSKNLKFFSQTNTHI